MCVCVRLYVEPVSRSKDYIRSQIKTGSVICLYTPVLPSMPETQGIYMPLGHPLLSAIISFCLLILHKRTRPNSVSDYNNSL